MTCPSIGLTSAAGTGWPPRSGIHLIHKSKQTSLSKDAALPSPPAQPAKGPNGAATSAGTRVSRPLSRSIMAHVERAETMTLPA